MNCFLALTLLLLPFAAAPPAAAQGQLSVLDDAVTRLKRRGVIPVLQEHCQPGIYGSYNHVTRKLVLCGQAMRDGLLTETVAHESVHVAQDCVAGAIGDGHSLPIYWRLLERGDPQAENFRATIKQSLVVRDKVAHALKSTKGMSNSRRTRELEAYGLEHNLYAALKIVEAACPLR